METYSVIKMRELIIHILTLMNLENTMLGETCQSPKATYCKIPCMWSDHNRQLHRDRRLWVVSRGVGEERKGLLMGMGFLFACWNVPELHSDDVAQSYEYSKKHWIVHFERVKFMICWFYLNLKNKRNYQSILSWLLSLPCLPLFSSKVSWEHFPHKLEIFEYLSPGLILKECKLRQNPAHSQFN